MGGVVVGAGAAGGEAEASGGVLRVACVRNKENSGIRCEIGKKKKSGVVEWSAWAGIWPNVWIAAHV